MKYTYKNLRFIKIKRAKKGYSECEIVLILEQNIVCEVCLHK